MSMYHVVQELVKPECQEHGAPLALVRNNWKARRVMGFVTHTWEEPFKEFMAALREVYRNRMTKPDLFICAFALFQGSFEDIQGALGEEIHEAPFVKALRAAEHFTVVRNRTTDL